LIPWPSIAGAFYVLAEVTMILGAVVIAALMLQLLTGDAENDFLGVALLAMFPLTAVAIALSIVDVIGVATGALNLVEALAP
jgi:hypothetical protein